MKNIFKNSFRKGIVTRPIAGLAVTAPVVTESLGNELKKVIRRRFSRSFRIREVDSGSCCACESEIIAATNPVYDIQRFGVDFVASPRHADCLLVTGPVSKNMELALRRTFEAMPEPKLVITFGDCARDGGIFKDSYYTCGGVGKVLTVHAHIPGCPPRPDDLVTALLSLLQKA
jgi:Ni,Fe-hydrogenase III small subunit